MAKKKSVSALPKKIYSLKITLKGAKPPIWRRVEVPDCTLSQLHNIIQQAMGWQFSHLWMFMIGGDTYTEPMDDPYGDEADDLVAGKYRLSQFAAAGVKKIEYQYDFGDSWDHTIAVEKSPDPDANAKYPRCVAGAGACPPEDCGGIWGYYHLLEVLANPKHAEHDDLSEWIGGAFDPDAFDVEAVNQRLRG